MSELFSRRPGAQVDKAFQSVLDWWDQMGVDIPPVTAVPVQKKRPGPKSVTQAPVRKQSAASTKPAPADPGIDDPIKVAAAAKSLHELETALRNFNAGPLSDGARQSVFARGNPDCDIMVIGEAPGRDEDIGGKPFIGRAGQLLDKMLGAIGLDENSAYITNVVNWRPPKNRNPKPEEIEMCRPFINRHIELFDPKLILIVGGVSLSAMTGISGIMKNRGQWQSITIGGKDIPALPIYHPAFLLRQPELKKDAWRDLLAFRERIE